MNTANVFGRSPDVDSFTPRFRFHFFFLYLFLFVLTNEKTILATFQLTFLTRFANGSWLWTCHCDLCSPYGTFFGNKDFKNILEMEMKIYIGRVPTDAVGRTVVYESTQLAKMPPHPLNPTGCILYLFPALPYHS